MRYSALLALIILVLAMPASYALTASIGNARMVLYPMVGDGETVTIDKSILVKNTNDISVKVALEADDRYKKIIDIFEKEVILEPGESRDVPFRITLTSGGRYGGKILVTFSSADPAARENKVSLMSTITIIANGTITDDYYDVMGEQTIPEEEEADEVIAGGVEEDSEDAAIEEGEAVSVLSTAGSSATAASEKTKTSTETSNNAFVGSLIVFVIVAAGLGLFFIIRKTVKSVK